MNSFEDYIVSQLWELHKSPRSQVGVLLASPRYDFSVTEMFGGQPVPRDFRLKGYTSQNMLSPRQPVRPTAVDEWKMNEEKLVRCFGDRSLYKPADTNLYLPSKTPSTGQRHVGQLQLKTLQDVVSSRIDNEDTRQVRKDRMDFDEDGGRIPYNKQKKDEGQFGGPGGSLTKRQQATPQLSDPRVGQQQGYPSQAFYQPQSPGVGRESMTPFEMAEYSKKLAKVSEEKRLLKEQRRETNFRQEPDILRNDNHRPEYTYTPPDFGRFDRKEEQRSLDLENTRGGAGAPYKDERGKSVTRRPITLSRDDYGESRIKETVPGRANKENIFEDENKPYFPWGGQGGGAPLRDKNGNVMTQVYGKLEGKDYHETEAIRNRRRQEAFFNELKEVEMQQKEKKDEFNRFLKAPQTELAEVMMAGRVGKPKRYESTGEIAQHHLGMSDISKVKANYQPVPANEKKRYHDELVQMAEERQYLKQLEKFKERQESNAHFKNMDSSWGNIGGGAPKHQVIRKKVNLTNALYYNDKADKAPETPLAPLIYQSHQPPTGLGSFEFLESQRSDAGYQKLTLDDTSRRIMSPEMTPAFLKNTNNGSHKNLYQPSHDHLYEKSGHHPVAPYATGGFR
ncbi:trichohyalin-like isoform X2 [Physella acuta]|uniref:trichohyalin-like isoform X2 n=1 Tax=Physella acuta TaxID=109671 RepID=UPI0027DE65BA|nr:trichohyalin-like isoform X2 [Physella acuta]